MPTPGFPFPSPSKYPGNGVAIMKQMLGFIKSHRDRSSRPPIDILPIELLGQIFTLVCRQSSRQWSKTPDDEIGPNSPSFAIPLFLGKICGSWRDLAWSMPSLWTDIDLVLPIAKHARYAELLEEWLGRSKGLPLSITFRRDESVRAGNVAVWGEQTLPLFHLISNEWQRWEHIDLFIPHGFCTLRMDNFKSMEMPLLRTAKLRGVQYSPGPSFLSNALNLRELCFRGTQFPSLTRPYPQLTRLIVNDLCLNDVMHIITHSPYLVTLYIVDSNAPFIAAPDQQQKISLKCLTSLTMIRSPWFSAILDNLELPDLLHLHLEGSPKKPLNLDQLSTFFRCNGRLLQSLVLAGFSEGWIGDVARHTPSLKKLTLHRDSTQGAVVFQSNLALHGLGFLPQLDYLEFHGAIAPFYEILNVLKWRWWAGKVQANSVDTPVSVDGGKPRKIRTVILPASLTEEGRAETQGFLRGELEEGMDLRFMHWTPTPTTD